MVLPILQMEKLRLRTARIQGSICSLYLPWCRQRGLLSLCDANFQSRFSGICVLPAATLRNRPVCSRADN